MPDNKSKPSVYGEGPREQYGEGTDYKPEDKTKAADAMGDNQAFAAGGGQHDKGASSRKMDDAKSPGQNEKPIPAQTSADPKGTGHESSKGGLPEKQPSKREQ